jgi:hypothetical protein
MGQQIADHELKIPAAAIQEMIAKSALGRSAIRVKRASWGGAPSAQVVH